MTRTFILSARRAGIITSESAAGRRAVIIGYARDGKAPGRKCDAGALHVVRVARHGVEFQFAAKDEMPTLGEIDGRFHRIPLVFVLHLYGDSALLDQSGTAFNPIALCQRYPNPPGVVEIQAMSTVIRPGMLDCKTRRHASCTPRWRKAPGTAAGIIRF